jgi:hypothetical protein
MSVKNKFPLESNFRSLTAPINELDAWSPSGEFPTVPFPAKNIKELSTYFV